MRTARNEQSADDGRGTEQGDLTVDAPSRAGHDLLAPTEGVDDSDATQGLGSTRREEPTEGDDPTEGLRADGAAPSGREATPAKRRRVPLHDPLIGTTVAGGYVILERIGAGGMGNVYRADHDVLRRSVAVKVMQERSSSNDLEARFQNEARAISMLTHPNIVDVLDSGFLDDGSPYIVMELLRGESLSERNRRGGWTREEPLEIALQLCAGVAVAHRASIVHRDLKPGNVFLAESKGGHPVLKLLDFGIAKFAADTHDSDYKTRTQAVLGTPQYMSPEQARRSSEVTAASDIYSIGVMLFQLLTGKLPYDISSAGELVFYVVSKRGVVADLEKVPKEWRPTIARCMAASPGDRFSSAEELLVDIVARIDGALEIAQRVIPSDYATLVPQTQIVVRAQRTRSTVRAVSAVVGALVAAGVAFWGYETWRLPAARPETPSSALVQGLPTEAPTAPAGPTPPSADAPAGAAAAAPLEPAVGSSVGVEPAAPLAHVQFVTRPADAVVRIVELDRRVTGAEWIDVPHGTYRVVAAKDGYRTTTRSIDIDSSTRTVVIQMPRAHRSSDGTSDSEEPTEVSGRRATSADAPSPRPEPSVQPEPSDRTSAATPSPSPTKAPRLDADDLFRSRQ